MTNVKADTYARERAALILLSRPSIGMTEDQLYSILYDAFTAGKNYAEFYMRDSESRR